MDDGTGRCSRIWIATFYFSLVSLLYGCNKKLSHQDKTNTKILNRDSIAAKRHIPGKPIVYNSNRRYIYITLDDGPQHGTMRCYHVLRKLDVKASFFMIGVQAMEEKQRKKADSIRQAYPQFLLCNHTYTHAFFNKYKTFYGNPDSALEDLEKAQDSMHVPLKIFRTPANNSWAINGRFRNPNLTSAFCKAADSAGYTAIGWDVVWNFKSGATPIQSADEMLLEVNNTFDHDGEFTKKHVVILAHDRMFEQQQYADSLSRIITLLKQDPRNVLETIDHYPGVASNN